MLKKKYYLFNFITTLSGIIIEIYSINDLGLIYLDSFFFLLTLVIMLI